MVGLAVVVDTRVLQDAEKGRIEEQKILVSAFMFLGMKTY
jgi:hypothetical protein